MHDANVARGAEAAPREAVPARSAPRFADRRDRMPGPAALRRWIVPLALIAGFAAVAATSIGMRPYPAPVAASAAAGEFSSGRAMAHVRAVAAHPHPTGTAANREVADYIAARLAAIGLAPAWQETTASACNPTVVCRVATVRNLIARLPGSAPTRAVLLVSHYDSAIASPGAADDGAAVAALLETARALRAGPALKNDVLVLFTDAEELGALGAKAFVEQHPAAREVGAVLNFEARGSGGPSVLFDLAPGSGDLVREMARSDPYASGTSFVASVFRLMSHQTDLARFKAANVRGLNFTFAEDWPRYHSATDSPARLQERSLQHHGVHALTLARQLGARDLRESPGADVVFFNLAGTWMVVYPVAWAIPLALLLLVAHLMVIRTASRRGWLRLKGFLGWTAVTFALSIVVMVVLTIAWARLMRDSSRAQMFEWQHAWFASAIVCLGIALTAAGPSMWGARVRPGNLIMGPLVWWQMLSLVTAFVAPGASYVFLWPLACALAAAVIWCAVPEEQAAAERSVPRIGAMLAACALAIWVLAPVIQNLFVALGRGVPIALALVVLAASLLAIPLHMAMRASRWLVPGVCGAAAVGLTLLGHVSGQFDDQRPRANRVAYVVDSQRSRAAWVTGDDVVDDWTAQFFGESAARVGGAAVLPEWYAGPALQAAAVWSAPTAMSALPAPSIVAEEPDASMAGRRRYRIVSPRGAPEVAVRFASDRPLANVTLVGGGGVPDQTLVNGSDVRLFCFGLSSEGMVIRLDAPAGQRIAIDIADRSYELPHALPVRPRPAAFTPAKGLGDTTIVWRRYTFE